MMMYIAEKVESKFKELFNEIPLMVRSPGRVNLIGEHTDYNMGFVLPAAIDKAIYLGIIPRDDDKCFLHAIDLNDSVQLQVSSVRAQAKNWTNYLLGVVDQIQKLGFTLKGFNCVFGGDIPIGAGLSSSAAIEAGLAYSLNHIFNLNIEKLELVKLSQRAENQFVGVNCGIMDQYINIFGAAKKVLKIDCRSLEYKYYPFENDDLRIVLVNTMVSHSLALSEYNSRRKQCEEGVKILQHYYPNITSLRDVEITMLNKHESKLDKEIYNRCKYVVEEIERVNLACNDLEQTNFISFGERMYETHNGLSKEYEVSCPELDFLVEEASQKAYVIGSRMMGGGFGGCTINLLGKEYVNEFQNEIDKNYRRRFNKSPEVYVCKIENGTNVLTSASNR